MPKRPRFAVWPLAAAACLHLTAIAIAIDALEASSRHAATRLPITSAPVEAPRATRLVFLPATAPGLGGGGGGNRQTGPVRRAESRGSDPITLRVAKPQRHSTDVEDTHPSEAGLTIEARPMASGLLEQAGLPEGGVSFGVSTGPGSGGGVGDGVGTGIGSGIGSGLGAGSGGGTGGGVYRPGGGVSPPTLLKEVRPTYDVHALSERIQGSVILELVVKPNGDPSDVRVVRTLDDGLDAEAVRAVRQWKFAPGRLNGVPVNVLVTVILDFTMR